MSPPILFNRLTGRVKRPISRGEIGHLIIRLVVFLFVAALDWVLYLSPRFSALVIPITAFLDFGGMYMVLLAAKRIVQFFNAKHAA